MILQHRTIDLRQPLILLINLNLKLLITQQLQQLLVLITLGFSQIGKSFQKISSSYGKTYTYFLIFPQYQIFKNILYHIISICILVILDGQLSSIFQYGYFCFLCSIYINLQVFFQRFYDALHINQSIFLKLLLHIFPLLRLYLILLKIIHIF